MRCRLFAHLSIQELLHQLEGLGDRAPLELIQAILSRVQEIVLPLSRVLEAKEYWEAQDNRIWMPVHAVKLLGTITDPNAIPHLINALALADETGDEWVMEDLPIVFGRLGSQAVEPLMDFILAHREDSEFDWPRSTAASGLVAIAMHHPEERERILSFLHSLFSEDEGPEFLGLVACALLDLNDPASIPVLEEAFDLGLIEEGILSREDLGREPNETIARYSTNLLEFYDPKQIAERQARWEEERREEERQAAQKRERREKSISRELRRLQAGADSKLISLSTRKVGRNEACPCGSGQKFKKCCLSLVEAIPPKQVLGGYLYATRDYL